MAENNKSPDQILVEGSLPADCVAALIYTTFPSREAAIAAGKTLVEERSAGCNNILPAMTSVYVWKGVTEVADEVVLIAKVPSDAVWACLEALRRTFVLDPKWNAGNSIQTKVPATKYLQHAD